MAVIVRALGEVNLINIGRDLKPRVKVTLDLLKQGISCWNCLHLLYCTRKYFLIFSCRACKATKFLENQKNSFYGNFSFKAYLGFEIIQK